MVKMREKYAKIYKKLYHENGDEDPDQDIEAKVMGMYNKERREFLESRGCRELTTLKYTSRKSPPYSANDCPESTRYGNDGEMWESVPNKNGIYRWMKIS